MNTTPSQEEFEEIIKPIIENDEVQKMKNYRQHADSSCYDHCMNVAYYTYYICKKLNLDYKSAARASMLHDFFLYDWRVKSDDRKGFHGFRHPRISLENAEKYFDLNEKEQDIILKHMWPITIKLSKKQGMGGSPIIGMILPLISILNHTLCGLCFSLNLNRSTSYLLLCLSLNFLP